MLCCCSFYSLAIHRATICTPVLLKWHTATVWEPRHLNWTLHCCLKGVGRELDIFCHSCLRGVSSDWNVEVGPSDVSCHRGRRGQPVHVMKGSEQPVGGSCTLWGLSWGFSGTMRLTVCCYQMLSVIGCWLTAARSRKRSAAANNVVEFTDSRLNCPHLTVQLL